MNEPRVCQREVRKRKISIIWLIYEEKWYRKTYLQHRVRCREQIYGYQAGKGGEGRTERLGLTYTHYWTQHRQLVRTRRVAQGAVVA